MHEVYVNFKYYIDLMAQLWEVFSIPFKPENMHKGILIDLFLILFLFF